MSVVELISGIITGIGITVIAYMLGVLVLCIGRYLWIAYRPTTAHEDAELAEWIDDGCPEGGFDWRNRCRVGAGMWA